MSILLWIPTCNTGRWASFKPYDQLASNALLELAECGLGRDDLGCEEIVLAEADDRNNGRARLGC